MISQIAVKIRLRLRSPSARALIGTSLGSLPGFILPFALSWRLHAGRLTDAYFLSFAIATFVASILSNVLEANVMPAAVLQMRSGSKSLARFVYATVRNAVGVAAVAYVPTAIVGVLIVKSRHTWSPPEQRLCITLIFIFGVYILATAVTSVLDGTLYALGQFFTSTFSQGLRTLLPLMFILLTQRNANGVIFTASLLVGGEIVRGGLLLAMLRRRMADVQAHGAPAGRSRLREASVPLALSLMVVAVSPVLDKIIASPLGRGSVTVLELSEKVFFVPLLAVSASFVLVAGSRWAALLHDKPESLQRDFERTLRRVLALAVVAAILVGGVTILVTEIAGNRFLGLDSSQFRGLVLIFVAGLPGAMVINQGARLMTALQRTRLLPLFAISSFTVNLVGDIIGAHFLGVDGIALASTGFRYVNAALYLWTCALLLRTIDAQAAGSGTPAPFLLR